MKQQKWQLKCVKVVRKKPVWSRKHQEKQVYQLAGGTHDKTKRLSLLLFIYLFLFCADLFIPYSLLLPYIMFLLYSILHFFYPISLCFSFWFYRHRPCNIRIWSVGLSIRQWYSVSNWLKLMNLSLQPRKFSGANSLHLFQNAGSLPALRGYQNL